MVGALMSDQSAQINPLIANLQKTNIDKIEFSKKQKWAITNYAVLIYAGPFWSSP
jgi:hypothetical protein